MKQVLVEAVDNFPKDVVHTDGLTDFGAVLGQMAVVMNNFCLFVIHYISNKLCKHFSNQTKSLNLFS